MQNWNKLINSLTKNMIKDFTDGLSSYTEAVRIVSKYGLWGYVLIPGLISLALGFGVFRAAWGWSDDVGGWLVSIYPFDWGEDLLQRIANVFGGILIAALGLVIFKQAVMALASPFMSFLSETVERKLAGKRDVPFSIKNMINDLIRGIRISLRNIIRELLFTFALFLIGLFPLFSPFAPVAIFIVQAYYAGFGNMDFTLERYCNVRQSVRFVRSYRALAIGNGAVFLLLLLTGVGFFFALPLGTVAATVETLRRLPARQ